MWWFAKYYRNHLLSLIYVGDVYPFFLQFQFLSIQELLHGICEEQCNPYNFHAIHNQFEGKYRMELVLFKTRKYKAFNRCNDHRIA